MLADARLDRLGHALVAGRRLRGKTKFDDGTAPAGAVSGARLLISGARASAAALARDLGQAQQQLAAVHGTIEEAEEGRESS